MNTIIITIIKEKERNRLEEFYLQRIILAPQGLGLPERTSLSTKGWIVWRIQGWNQKKFLEYWCFKWTTIVLQHFSTSIMH